MTTKELFDQIAGLSLADLEATQQRLLSELAVNRQLLALKRAQAKPDRKRVTGTRTRKKKAETVPIENGQETVQA